MTEPRRWLETGDAPSEVLALLERALPSRPLDRATKQRSRRRLAGLAALPAAAGTMLWLQHAAYGAVLGIAVTSAVTVAPLVLSKHETKEPGPAPMTTAKQRAAPPKARAESLPVPGAEAPAPPVEAFPTIQPSRPAASGRTEPVEHELAREARSLERARSLVAVAPGEALAALGRHQTEFPHGTLEVEREFLEVEALVRLGRKAEAERVARILRSRAPGSLYEQRLERLMASGK